MTREMKLLVAACALILATTVLAACGGAHASVPVVTDVAPNPPRPPHGFLFVSIYRAGGPPGGGKLAGLVSIFNGHNRLIGRLHVKEGHSSKVWLRPGHYSLGLGKRRPTQKRLGGCHPTLATVQVGRTTHYKLLFGCLYP
jgi:hypothetical protein